MLYRLFIMRRLILACVVPVVLVAWAVDINPLTAAVLALAGFGLLLVLSPGSYIEALAMALATCVSLPVIVYATRNLPFRLDGHEAQVAMLFVVLGFGWFCAMLGFVKLIAWTDRFARGQITLSARTVVPLPIDQAMEALCVQPGRVMAHRRCGPADANGVFQITFGVQAVDTTSFEPEQQDFSYQARVIEAFEDDGAQVHVAQNFMWLNGRDSSSVVRMRFQAQGDSTLVISEEVSDHLTWLSWATFWLRDFGADHMKAEIEGYLGRDGQTSVCRANTGVLVALARFFVRTGLAGKPGDRP